MWATIHQKFNKLLDLTVSPLMLIGSFSLAQIKEILGIIGIIITITYTIWKWCREINDCKK